MGVPLISVTSVETVSTLVSLWAGLDDILASPLAGFDDIVSPGIGFIKMFSSLNISLSWILLKWLIILFCLLVPLQQNLYSKIPLTTSTASVITLLVVPKIVLMRLFFANCFKWNFFLTSTISIGLLLLSCSSLINSMKALSSYSWTLIKSFRCKFKLFCLRIMSSSTSIPEVNTCWFILHLHPGCKLTMLNPTILFFSCLFFGQFI